MIKTHESALQDNENSHVAAINAIKSHMTFEKNKEIETINEEFSQQKGVVPLVLFIHESLVKKLLKSGEKF